MATFEKPEVSVSNRLTPFPESDRARKAVCLLRSTSQDPSMSWSGTGFYVNVKLKKNGKVNDVHCIMTNHHVYLEMIRRGDNMVAIFHYEDSEKKSFELPLVPFKLLARSSGEFEKLDYVLIRIKNQSLMREMDVKPIMVDDQKIPEVKIDDTVHIIQHPEGGIKHFSQDKVRRVNKPFIEYYADTLSGSSGSPVFLLRGSQCSLVALHSKGVVDESNRTWNKGVLISCILEHLHKGKVTLPDLSLSGVPDVMESGVRGNKDPAKPVSREDIIHIAQDITKEWFKLGRALGHKDSTLDIIDADNPKAYEKSYQMLIQWTQIMVSKATYGALAEGFKNPTVHRRDLIAKYC